MGDIPAWMLDHAEAAVADWPPLSERQKTQIAAALRPEPAAERPARRKPTREPRQPAA